MTTVNKASLVLKDKDGNAGFINGLTAEDIALLNTAIRVTHRSGLPLYGSTYNYEVGEVVRSGTFIYQCIVANGPSQTGGIHAPTDTTYWKQIGSVSDATTTSKGIVQLASNEAVAAGTAGLVVDAAQLKALKDSTVPLSEQFLINVENAYTEPDERRGILYPATNRITPPSSSHTFEARGVKTGVVELFAGTSIPDGYLLCNGAAVSRTVYADLFEVIGTVYGTGDGSTTFNLPDMRNRYPIGAGDNAPGTYVAEQLPNITGFSVTQFVRDGGAEGLANGALSYSTSSGSIIGMGTSMQLSYISFNAHDSNAIYTGNGKVYPASLALNFIIKT